MAGRFRAYSIVLMIAFAGLIITSAAMSAKKTIPPGQAKKIERKAEPSAQKVADKTAKSADKKTVKNRPAFPGQAKVKTTGAAARPADKIADKNLNSASKKTAPKTMPSRGKMKCKSK